jgi:hypothetical protein
MIGAERSILLCRTDNSIVHDSTWITDPVSWSRLLVDKLRALAESFAEDGIIAFERPKQPGTQDARPVP